MVAPGLSESEWQVIDLDGGSLDSLCLVFLSLSQSFIVGEGTPAKLSSHT